MVSVPGAALSVSVGHANAAGRADLVAAAAVFVVGGDIADGLVEAHCVVVGADAFQFVLEHAWIGNGHEVGVFAFDVSPQGLYPGLVGGGGAAAEVLGY